MNRREFVALAGLATASSAWPRTGTGDSATDEWRTAFARALQDDAGLLGWRGIATQSSTPPSSSWRARGPMRFAASSTAWARRSRGRRQALSSLVRRRRHGAVISHRGGTHRASRPLRRHRQAPGQARRRHAVASCVRHAAPGTQAHLEPRFAKPSEHQRRLPCWRAARPMGGRLRPPDRSDQPRDGWQEVLAGGSRRGSVHRPSEVGARRHPVWVWLRPPARPAGDLSRGPGRCAPLRRHGAGRSARHGARFRSHRAPSRLRALAVCVRPRAVLTGDELPRRPRVAS